MDEESGERKPETTTSGNKIQEHLSAAEKALDRRDYCQARRETEKAREATAEMQEKIVAEELASTQFKIIYARNIGADAKDAEQILLDAKAAHAAGELTKSLELARQCRQEAERAKERCKELVDLIYEAETLISEAHTVGKDTAEAEKHLTKAVNEKSRNGVEALSEAIEARRAVSRALGRSPPQTQIAPVSENSLSPSAEGADKERVKQFLLDMKHALLENRQARGKGIDTTRSWRLFSNAAELATEATKNGSSNIETPREFLRRSRVALAEEIELANPVVKPELRLKGFLARSLRYGDWNDALPVLQNTGETAAHEVSVKLKGEIELESIQPLGELASREKRELKIRLRPRSLGEASVEIQVSFKRAYDGKAVVTSAKSKLTVR